jgi:hypothetical protein
VSALCGAATFLDWIIQRFDLGTGKRVIDFGIT